MTSPAGGFKRMVVDLPQSMTNQGAVDVAAELAEFLNIELRATFVADTSLPGLAGFSPAREFRILDRGWQSIDLAQITRDIEQAANAARRRFAEAVRSCSIKTSFDVIAGVQAMASLIRADDIVAIIEPSHPGERITRQFTGQLNAALEAAGAVLILPQRIARTAGPIMAIAGPERGSIRAALEIAVALKEGLVVVTGRGAALAADIVTLARERGIHVEQVAASGLMTDTSMPAMWEMSAPSPSGVKERLRVVTRGQVPNDATRLFTMLQGVPLLVVEPDRLGAPEQENEAH
jgi:hypothetical protein